MKHKRLSAIDIASGEITPMTCRQPIISSSNTNWEGIILEQHHLPPSESPELCLQQHSISIMLGSEYQIDWRLAGGKLHSTKMRRGEIGLTPRDIPTQARWYQDVEFLLISLDSNVFKQLEDNKVDSEDIEIIPQRGFPDAQIFHLGMALKAELEGGCLAGKIYADSVAIALASHLIKNHCTSKQVISESEDNLSERQLRQIIDYIHDNLGSNLTLRELASLVEMNSYSFCRWFKHSMRITPHQYVIKSRIERAKFLLTHTQLSIVEIALDVGCSSQSNFTALFRKQVGNTPKYYRDNTCF
ncbi:helix-turn-helix transcriptional regulator [Mastigocoleus testarum]|uniref:HTH araC/xylS-type domain-containing protein n=1 Tax=Mastigocoleus testarum BC008 TaxID=371196 RepID=A0A0V7ZXA1_9CYAN|nr:AraC family transcriptional regulator [Mastigocoleus testarum]KST69232.1 hypothetical protein BC008_03325 [Mastigocoleus testarum BC008]